jgi:adenine deaminase
MKAMLRLGSAWHDVDDQVRAITELKLDSRNFILCTDDCHSETLVKEGHVNRAVVQAIRRGLPPIIAIQMATLNPATHFGLAREIGQIAPGRYADILVVSDLPGLQIDQVIAKGRLAAQSGRLGIDLPAYEYPDWAKNSVNLGKPLTAADFRLPVASAPQAGAQERRTPADGTPRPATGIANVIGVIENQAPTRHLRLEMPLRDGEAQVDMARDIAKIALIERHRGTGAVQVGLVNGFGFTVPCAVGSTVAHDSHHMIVVGTDEASMARAANELAAMGGGQIAVRQGEVIGKVALPIAGLMSNERAEGVAQQAASVLEGFRACGCTLNNPNMQLSLLALVVIPELRISDLGLVDVTRFEFIPVIEG